MAVPIIVSLLGASLLGLLIYGISHQASSRSLDEALHHGVHPLAPRGGEKLPILGGAGERSLGAYRGKVVLLNFWASWCTPCEEEAPLMEKLQRQMTGHGATVLGVTYEDNTSDSESFVKNFGLTYPNLRDVSGEFAHSYGTDQLPESFLINRSGDVVDISRGEIEKVFEERAIELVDNT